MGDISDYAKRVEGKIELLEKRIEILTDMNRAKNQALMKYEKELAEAKKACQCTESFEQLKKELLRVIKSRDEWRTRAINRRNYLQELIKRHSTFSNWIQAFVDADKEVLQTEFWENRAEKVRNLEGFTFTENEDDE